MESQLSTEKTRRMSETEEWKQFQVRFSSAGCDSVTGYEMSIFPG